MKRRKVLFLKYLVSRNKGYLLKVLLLITTCSLTLGWFLSDATSAALRTPEVHQDLHHFRWSRSLDHYLNNIQVLIEPSVTACDHNASVSLLALVTSSPLRFDHRQAIRGSWAARLPTYFVMGVSGPSADDLLVDNYVEAKMYSDLIIYDLRDHYQNLTLKTVLMMKWTLERCPHAEFLLKTDDDVLVNPWMMEKVLTDHKDSALIGYRKDGTNLHRDEHSKWYLPRWLHHEDHISQYLSGTGYLVNGKYIKPILDAASGVPLVNLEDVYLTYLVAKMKLGLHLTHDDRLSPYKPWLPFTCMYWNLASAHSLHPEEILNIWSGLVKLGEEYEKQQGRICKFYATYFSSSLFLY